MALGGGTFTVQNKILPGAYINFVSVASASATLSERGVAAMAVSTGWGTSGDVFEVTSTDFIKHSLELFGSAYVAEDMKPLRELFCHARKAYIYRLDGNGTKASNDFGTAKYAGTKGNSIKIVVQTNSDNEEAFDISTYFGTTKVDTQTVSSADELIDNDYVNFNTSAELAVTAATPLTGGTDSTIDSTAHQTFLTKVEKYSFNAIGCTSSDNATKELYVSFCKTLRDDYGKKCQCVVYDKAADYEGVVNVKNSLDLVPWVLGVVAGTLVNKSATNMLYDGELSVHTSYTQAQLENAIKAGELVLHQVGDDVRILMDINSLVTTSDTKGEVFKDNQTIRVIDQIANDIAVLFNTRYLGVVPNDNSGRISLWADIVKHHMELQDIRAIQNFEDDDVEVSLGNNPRSVVVSDAITVVGTMTKLYMTVTVQ